APGGTGAACVLTACVAALFALNGKKLAVTNLSMAGILVLVAGMMVWHHWWLLGVVAWASLVVLAVKLRRPDWRLPESLWASGWTAALAPMKALGHFVAGAMRSADARKAPSTESTRVPVRAILIPLGICILFIFIFSAANPVVARLTEDFRKAIGDWFRYLRDVITLGRIVVWSLWLMAFAALVRPAAKSVLADFLARLDEGLKTPDEDPDDGNYVTALATLISVNILFLVYNCIDSNYLYFKAALPKGITWADYTHAGCGWLTFGLFVSTMVIGFTFWRRQNFHPKARHLKLFCYIWAVQNGVLAVGAIRRLQMYIDFSGLTHLRITGIYGSLLVASGLAIMVRKVRANRSLIWLLHNYVLAFCVAVVVLVLTPGNWLCASYNARKAMEGKPRALRPICLKELAPGALPPLIPLLDYSTAGGDPGKEKLVREGIAAILGQHLARLEAEEASSWTQWQLSSAWALKRLRAARDDIHTALPPARWDEAEKQLRNNYDLTDPVFPGSWSMGTRREYR
ncbi:DUF4153 domain-containing protein, partial [Verrucomicrobiota bacterium]